MDDGIRKTDDALLREVQARWTREVASEIRSLENRLSALSARPPWRFGPQEIVAVLAVLGMLASGAISWALMGERLRMVETRSEQTASRMTVLEEQVTELRYEARDLTRAQKRMEESQGVTAVKVAEIYEAWLRMGLHIPKGHK